MKSKMKHSFLFTFFILFISAQNKFEITYKSEPIENVLKVRKMYKKTKVLFNDKDFLVTSTCSGEWGGTILFREKSTQKVYAAQATCPISVDKLDKKFYITSTLAHLRGFSDIIRINDPKKLKIFQKPKLRKEKGKLIFHVGDNESKSKIGTETILDSVGIFTLATFLNENKFYYIVTDFQNTYLSVIENQKFKTLETLKIEDVWSYESEIIKISNNHIILLFSDENQGYIEIDENKIRVVTTL